MLRTLTYFIFAECWGWTPGDVDEIEVTEVYRLRALLEETMKEREKMSRRERKKLDEMMRYG